MKEKYICVLFVTYMDDTKKDTSSIYTYDDRQECIQSFYKRMGTYVNADDVATVTVEVKSSIGTIIKNDAWIRPIEPEETEED